MRKFICFLFLLASIICANAQKNYTITYSYYNGVDTMNEKLNNYTGLRLSLHIYADTLSFCRHWLYKPRMTKREYVMSKDANHGTLHHLKSDSVLSIATYTSDKRLIKFSESYKWKILNDTTTIIGIKCIKAESDLGITAWFAPSIPVNAGPEAYYGLPGLILRVNNNRRAIILIADRILYDAPSLVYPENIKIVEMVKTTNTQ